MSDSLFDGFNELKNAFDGHNSTSNTTKCVSLINHFRFYQYTLIPSTVLTIMFAATKIRRNQLLNVLGGRPGLLSPMDTLTRSSRISYACAFGVTAFLIYQILLEQKYAVDYGGPSYLKALIVVLSMFVYGLVFFPVFACLALGTAFSYGMGSLYVWMFFGVEITKLCECDYTQSERALLVVRALPSLVCHVYLSVSIPARFGLALVKGRYFTSSLGQEEPLVETLQEIRDSFQGRHVRQLLAPPKVEVPREGAWNKVKDTVKGMLSRWVYQRQSGFRYPSRLLSVMFVAAIVVYVLTTELLIVLVPPLRYVINSLTDQLDYIGWNEIEGEPQQLTDYRWGVFIAYKIAYVMNACIIVSVTIGMAISFLTILHMMSSFRTNLYAMYRGDFRIIPSPAENSPVSLCVGSIKYAGFQVAYIVWSYIITVLILLILCVLLAIIILFLIYGETEWLVSLIATICPSVAIAMLLMVAQMMLAKFFFLQGRGEYVRLNNRRFYFIFVYFMFFYNIFLGLVSCLLRIIKAIGVGTIFLARLDNSTLPRKFEFFDPGFSAYKGYIHVEAAHTHPVVNVFIRLLMSLKNERQMEKSQSAFIELKEMKDMKNGEHLFSKGARTCDKYVYQADEQRDDDVTKHQDVNVAARFNWHVLYTLLHNPSIRIYRKGYIQAVRKARREGRRIPISDKPISSFDIIKSDTEREAERAEEVKKIKAMSDVVLQALSQARSASTINIDSSDRIQKVPDREFLTKGWLKARNHHLNNTEGTTMKDEDDNSKTLGIDNVGYAGVDRDKVKNSNLHEERSPADNSECASDNRKLSLI